MPKSRIYNHNSITGKGKRKQCRFKTRQQKKHHNIHHSAFKL